MKQHFIHYLIVLLAMAFPFHLSGSNKDIDFNFPQDVSKTALTDLNKALKTGDGEATVDALVRYSIAQSSISQDNMPEIIERIDKVIAKEKQPHIKALLYHLEALAFQGYSQRFARSNRNNPVEEMPTDISEWDRSQFENKIKELLNKSLEDPNALEQVPVTSMPNVIKCNQLGATYVPTLLQFIAMRNYEMLNDIEYDNPEAMSAKLIWQHSTEGDAPSHIYALINTNGRMDLETYEKYKDSEYSAELLEHIYFKDSKEELRVLNEYVERHPKSLFIPGVKNMITELKNKSAFVKYPTTLTSRDSVHITVDSKNANQFNINVYRVSFSMLDNYKINLKDMTPEVVYPMHVQGNIPFTANDLKVTLPPLPYGAYIICAKTDVDENTTESCDIYSYDIMRVTDIAMFYVSRTDHQDRVAAVDVITGKPMPGVTISYENGKVGETGSDGTLLLPNTYIDRYGNERSFSGVTLMASKGEDKFAQFLPFHQTSQYSYNERHGELYTDLGVYRPGETIHWAAIAYYIGENGRTPLSECTLQAIFKDRNYKGIDTVEVNTDEFGRAEGSFIVPKDRMNGEFIIELRIKNDNYLSTHYVNVSEYKTPTFDVTFPDARTNYVGGEPVKVTGLVETYSGMPVANTQVRLSLIQNEWTWWWWRAGNRNGKHLMDTIVTTDAQGKFTFEYPASLFEENQSKYFYWSRYNYKVVATATSDAGETQEGETNFIVGTRRGISIGSAHRDIYLNNKPITLPVTYNTTDEQNTSTWCSWEITPQGETVPVKTGNFNTDDPTIDVTDLPSGVYRLKVHILDANKGEEDVDAETTITLYRKSDKVPPIKDCPLWVAPTENCIDKNNTAHINIGVSVPRSYIYYVASTCNRILGQGWLNYEKGMHDFTLNLPKVAGEDVTVELISYYGLSKLWSETINLDNPYKAEALKITATSFRDKLLSGDHEHWTFTLTDQNDKPHRGAMLLSMYDKAISKIADNTWSFKNWRKRGKQARMGFTWASGSESTRTRWDGKLLEIPDELDAVIPYLNTYGQRLFGIRMSNYLDREAALGATRVETRLMKSSVAKEAPMMDDAQYANEESAEAEEVQVDESRLDEVALRESDVKTALWMPMLTSDNKGNISVEFDSPNFNTTWITQAVAWDDKMVGSKWMAEVLTQKPLMVRSSMPRFLRQGDKTKLAATVQNATDQIGTCDAIIELFDPRTEEVFASRKFNLRLDPMGSQAVNIDWTVPDTISFVGFRIKAANDRFSDGEQVMVPVLTTISPVIETEPFYIEAGQNHYETALPKFPADARVTLEYCDNPIWYCALALPTIFSDSYCTASHAAHSLFALEVAQGIAKAQPQIKEAVDYWKQHDEDSTLVSMLQKNQDLKIGTLLASPWMRDADKQTLRMSKLHQLFDNGFVHNNYEKIIAALQSLQMSDGGFTWYLYPECHSDYWTTGMVLEFIGEIKHLGYLPDDSRLTSMINRALDYYDLQSLRSLSDYKKYLKNPYAEFVNFAYVRSLFPDQKPSGSIADLIKKTATYMDKNWNKGITIKEKAYYAMTLHRFGHKKTALKIIESIRQFAITKPNTGMYWDNLQTGYSWWEFDKVAYTSTILRAMNEIDPRQEELDQVRKWMLLMKQSNDWGSYSLAADAVYSILSTGSKWLERNTLPAITVAGESINLDKMAEWLGYFRTSLPATTTGNVIIDRSGKGPAWGAVYSQFKSPMTQIKEKAIDEVSISKEYYVYAQDGSLHQATSFKVGDKVKVRVIVKVNKDMDYVTITDERAACFEPVDQLSGHRREDRTWFYLETKDSQTNIFFNSLSKGTHIIGYDVWVTNPGEFTSGIATIQCQYAPQLSAHSAGKSISIEGK